jgi:hypothetical protein
MVKDKYSNIYSEMLIIGLIIRHTNECADEQCCCQNRKSLYDFETDSFANEEGFFLNKQ